MPVTTAADRWASKIVIVVQLVTWNAIGIVIIQSGVSTLRQRTLETYNNRSETNTTVNLDVESAVSTERTENEHDLTVISTRQRDENAKAEPPTRLDYSGASAIDRGAEKERPVDHLENGRNLDAISRLDRDKEREPQALNSVHADSIFKSVRKEKNETAATGKNPDFVGTVLSNGSQLEGLERAKETTSENIDNTRFAGVIWKRKNRHIFFHVRANNLTMGVSLVVIGCIMLLIGLAVIIIRILDIRRRRAKDAYALSWEDPPPTYAEAVYLSEAPRYSTLALNEKSI